MKRKNYVSKLQCKLYLYIFMSIFLLFKLWKYENFDKKTYQQDQMCFNENG